MKTFMHISTSIALLSILASGAQAQVTERQLQEAMAEAVVAHPSMAEGARVQLTNVQPANTAALQRARAIQRVDFSRDQSPFGLVTARVFLDIPSDPGVWIWVRARSRALVPTVIVIRDIKRGATLTRGDIEVIHKPPHAQGLAEPEMVVGQRTRRNLRAGERALKSWIEMAPLVQRGDRLQAEIRKGGLLVRAPAVALGRGGAGDMIKLKIPATGRVVRGRIVSARRVEVIQ